MAFISLLFVFLIFILGTLAVSAVIGIVLLVFAARKRKRGEGKATTMTVAGGIFLFIPVGAVTVVGTIIAVSVIGTTIQRTTYNNLIDKWRNEWVLDHVAREELVENVLEAADNNDAAALKALFTNEIQQNEALDEQIEIFLENYPGGLSDGRLISDGGMSGGSYDDGVYFYCDFKVEKQDTIYYIDIGACYGNEENTDAVGMEYLIIESESAYVLEIPREEGEYIRITEGVEEESEID